MAQRQILTQQAIVKADGSCTFTFPDPPSGYAFTGSVSVYNSGTTTVWTIAIAGTPMATVIGTSSLGGIQQFGNEIMTISATGLSPGVIYNASYTASFDTEQNTPITAPDTAVQSLQIAAGSVTASISGTVNTNITGGSVVVSSITTGTVDIGTVTGQVTVGGAQDVLIATGATGTMSNDQVYSTTINIPTGILSVAIYIQKTAGTSGIPYYASVQIVNPVGGNGLGGLGYFRGIQTGGSWAGPVALDVPAGVNSVSFQLTNVDPTTNAAYNYTIVGYSLPAHMVGKNEWFNPGWHTNGLPSATNFVTGSNSSGIALTVPGGMTYRLWNMAIAVTSGGIGWIGINGNTLWCPATGPGQNSMSLGPGGYTLGPGQTIQGFVNGTATCNFIVTYSTDG